MQNSRFRVLRTAGALVLSGGLFWLYAALWIHLKSHEFSSAPSETLCPALVFGCRPGPRLDRRVDAAYAVYQQGYASEIVCSGRNEAQSAAARLRSLGMNEARIQIESEAQNTVQNLIFAQRLTKSEVFHVVSDTWHIPRILMITKELGLIAYPHPVAETTTRLQYVKCLTRESLSLVNRWVSRRVSLE